MESKLLIGGRNIMDHTNEQQKMLELKRQEIAEQVGLGVFEASGPLGVPGLEVMSRSHWAVSHSGLRIPRITAGNLRHTTWIPCIYQPAASGCFRPAGG